MAAIRRDPQVKAASFAVDRAFRHLSIQWGISVGAERRYDIRARLSSVAQRRSTRRVCVQRLGVRSDVYIAIRRSASRSQRLRVVQEVCQGLQSFRNMSRMDASRRKANGTRDWCVLGQGLRLYFNRRSAYGNGHRSAEPVTTEGRGDGLIAPGSDGCLPPDLGV
jgi:hypothetical protein